ncbi:Lrp/AsnC family transcriptional regulator [Hwanghaeella sp.]|uniref:Lrp/AsnC family transcriptional regulator n=1 Tax=Hwanghaeella sp. TaxID=2605943 RepID=UPI003CCBE98E
MKRLRYEDQGLDGVDAAILDVLIENARVSIADLARRVGLSPPSVSERLKRLEEARVITGYSIAVDPAALGLPIAAWIRVRPLPGELTRVVTILQALPEIVECDRITGEDCFLAKAHLRSVEDLEALLDEVIPYATTNTSIIQSSPVPRRLPIVPRKERGAA